MAIKTRYEMEFRAETNGGAWVTIYDDYWDTVQIMCLIDRNGKPCMSAFETLHQILDGLERKIKDVNPGDWYAVRVEDYPFGDTVEVVRIPGRNLEYKSE